MPLQQTTGNVTTDAYGGGVAAVPNYIEDVFSTYLYTGNGSTQTITNGIDLAGEGGLVWTKNRIQTYNHTLIDSENGVGYQLESNTTAALANGGSSVISSFNNDGFSIGSAGRINYSGDGIVSWTFRKQPKFFDVVTFSGTGSQQSINHNLGSVPGCIIVKRTDTTSSYWGVYHRSSTDGYALGLNTTDAEFNAPSFFVNSASQTSTQFTVGTSANVNASGGTYVAYLYAHNAGGFGLTGTDNVISCGSVTTDGSGNGSVTLGYEPQWLLVKRTDDTSQWYLADNMRGMPVSGDGARLFANLSNAESTSASWFRPNATGFTIDSGMFASAVNLIYIAIRRGPMKVPTSGTSVFAPFVNGATTTPGYVTSFPPDFCIAGEKNGTDKWYAVDRLRGAFRLNTASTAAEASQSSVAFYQNGAFNQDWQYGYNSWVFRRAPSFFDEVCYTGDGAIPRTITHNLTVAPELIITKARSSSSFNWMVGCNFGASNYQVMYLDATNAATTTTYGNYTGPYAIKPTSTTYGITGDSNAVNQSGTTYVAYLFATAAGVSKVGSYTGTGTTKQVDCGFTGGARFVLIKKTSGTGSWYVWDSARGIVSGNDPYLLLNSTAAEVTSTDYIDTYSAGFEISSTAPSEINESGGSFIFLAIA